MNKTKGNMYEFVDFTWNPVKGKCSHDCEYCYMKKWKQKPLRLDEKEFTDLGKDNFIFVGSGCDLFAEDVPDEWIYKVLDHCRLYGNNKYLFQSKNPIRFMDKSFPVSTVLGTTIESNRCYYPKNPSPKQRAQILHLINRTETMVTIEPIMDFDLDELVSLIRFANPNWVNIGANSRNDIKLPEPSKEKIIALINRLQQYTEVREKKNLKRLLK